MTSHRIGPWASAMIASPIIEQARAVPIETEITRRGIRLRGKVERSGPCPVCGGRDRFAINIRKQSWNCRGCQRGGGVIDLVQHLDGLSFPEAVALLTRDTVSRPQVKPQPVVDRNADDESAIREALIIWREALNPRGTLVETYLARRGLTLPEEAADVAIRFHESCRFGPDFLPAMIALVRDVKTNRPKAIHRTALTPDGRRTARRGLGPVGGGAVKLTPDEDVTLCLGIGEGVETTLAMRSIPEFGASPIWSLLSSGQIAQFPVLPGIEALWIAVDHDDAGERAANECGDLWRAEGREVFFVRPNAAGDDLNDIGVRS